MLYNIQFNVDLYIIARYFYLYTLGNVKSYIHHTNSITIYKLYIPYNLTYNNIYNCQVLLPLHPWQPFNIPLVNISMLSLRANAGIFFLSTIFGVKIVIQTLSKLRNKYCPNVKLSHVFTTLINIQV